MPTPRTPKPTPPPTPQGLLSWDEADRTLSEIATLTRQIDAHNAQLDEKIAVLRERAATALGAALLIRDELVLKLKAFAETHRAELLDVRHRPLTHGTVAFRRSRRVAFDDADTVVAVLQRLGLTGCVVTTHRPDKAQMAKLAPAILAQTGARLEERDEFAFTLKTEAPTRPGKAVSA